METQIINNKDKGKIRVGRSIYVTNGFKFPSFDNFTPIVVLTKSSAYGSLGPYELRDKEGKCMENIWQFSKVYRIVPATKSYYTERLRKLVWDWPVETHTNEKGEPNELYWKWRDTGMKASMPIRYPVGKSPKIRASCLYSLKEKGGDHLNYIEARKQIYFPIYVDLVKKQRQFEELKQRLEKGENLLIIETDGPHQESLRHYKENYGVSDDFIEKETMLATPRNISIMMNDTKHAFGHGYCLAAALLGIDDFVMKM